MKVSGLEFSPKKTNMILFNPLTAQVRKFSGMKSARIHACKQQNYLMGLEQIYFQYCTFCRSPFTCSCEEWKKP